MMIYSIPVAGPIVVVQPPTGVDPATVVNAVNAIKAAPGGALYASNVTTQEPASPLLVWGTLLGSLVLGFAIGRATS